MANIYQFPNKDDQQWSRVSSELTRLLTIHSASASEIDVLLKRLRPRWEALGQPFELQSSHSLVGPLNSEQLASIDAAFRAQADEIIENLKNQNAATLDEFAKLELQLLRLQSKLFSANGG
jgi:hypothetical protein